MGLSCRKNFRTGKNPPPDERKAGNSKAGVFVFLVVLIIAGYVFYPDALKIINGYQAPDQAEEPSGAPEGEAIPAENKPGAPGPSTDAKQENSGTELKEPAYEILDLDSMYGMPLSQLSLDPADITGNTHLGKEAVLPDRGGWKKVYLTFNKNDRLRTMAFVPKSPLSLTEAKNKMLEMYKTDLPEKFKHETPSVVSYEELPGKISKINFYYRNSQNHSRGINEIGIFYNIGLND